MPIGWRVLAHNSSSVSFEVYCPLLRRVSRLVPTGAEVRFLADRGNASTQLMRYSLAGIRVALPHPGQKRPVGMAWGQTPESTQALSPGRV